MTDSPTSDLAGPRSSWERGLEWAAAYGPMATLALGTIFAFVTGGVVNPLLTLALVGLSAAWVGVVGPLRSVPGQRRLRIYLLGYLGLSMWLMLQHPLFLIFPVGAFFQVHLLRPAPVTFLGVLATSLVVNSLIVMSGPTATAVWIYGVVVLIQTLAIGLGVIGGEKINDLSEARRRAVVQLEEALQQNQGLQAQLVEQAREAGVADERARMAREIHDTIAQGITAVITQLEAASHVIDDREALRRHLENASRIARESLVEARRAVRAAIPLQLEGRSLAGAIGDVVERWSAVNPVDVEWSVNGEQMTLHPEIEVTFLRVVQEALANVAKHAAAARVAVTLSYMGDVAVVDVRDDGKGFDGPVAEGFGMRGMRSRVEELDGEISIESEAGRGTAVSVTLPAVGVDDG